MTVLIRAAERAEVAATSDLDNHYIESPTWQHR
jgi:hypothetical protein